MDTNLYGFIFWCPFLSLQVGAWEPFLSENSQSQEIVSEENKFCKIQDS